MKRQIALGAMAVVAVATIVGLGDATDANAAKVKAPYTKQAYIAKGKKIRLSANKKSTFVSKNKAVVSVTKKGVVTGKKVGNAKIVVTEKQNPKKKGVVTVRVMKTAVKKVTLSKKKATLNMGESLRLKAKVKAKKGASKRIHWVSAKPSVAAVTSKGVVKAKKAGSTVITAKATDGSGKKAGCRVTVKEGIPGLVPSVIPITPTDSSLKLTSFEIKNSNSFTFSLSRPYTIDMSSVVVKRKKVSTATYRDMLELDTVQTTDRIHYTVTLMGNSSLDDGEYVQLEIKGLHRNNVLEQQFIPSPKNYVYETTYTGTVGESILIYDGINGVTGYLDMTLTGLPDGVSGSMSQKDVLRFVGTPTKAGTYTVEMQGTDEAGNHFTEIWHFCIGSPDTIAAKATKTYGMVEADQAAVYTKAITVTGGSGQYTYELLSGDEEMRLDTTTGEVTAHVSDVGEYQAKVKIMDATDPLISTEILVECSITRGMVINGIVKDGEGKNITDTTDVDVDFIIKENDNRYYEAAYKYYSIASNGAFRAVLPAGTYDIEAYTDYANGSVYVYDYVISEETQEMTISLPVYRVELSAPNNDEFLKDVSWGDAENYLIGDGNVLYLKKGTHTIHSSWKGFMNWKNRGKATFTIVDKGIQVNVDVETEVGAMTTLALAELGTIELQATSTEYGFFSFTPMETGAYRIYSSIPEGSGYYDTYGLLYSSEGVMLAANNYNLNHPTNGNQFMIEAELMAGQTYYIGARFYYSSNSTSIPVTVEKVQ